MAGDTAALAERLEERKQQNDAALARLVGLGVQVNGIDIQYLIILCERLLKSSTFGDRLLAEAQMAHADWLAEQLGRAESQIRQQMITAGVANGQGPSSPVRR